MTPRTRNESDPRAEAIMEELRRGYQPPPAKNHWLGWLFIAVLVGYGLAQLGGHKAQAPLERSPAVSATDYAPRAERVQNDFAPRPIGGSFGVKMPDGTNVTVTVRNAVSSPSALPLGGNQLGDCRYVASDRHWYIWLTQAGSVLPTWIDP